MIELCDIHKRFGSTEVLRGVCDASEPELQSIAEGQDVSCFLYGKA